MIPQALDRKIRTAADGCWEWIAYKDPHGYGRVSFGGKKAQLAHRVVYEMVKGPIPEGLTLDHLCRNRGCVNPEHLDPVTRGENVLRGEHPLAVLHREGRCKNGHPLSEQYRRKDGRSLGCRVCINAKARKRYAERNQSA